MIGFSKEVDYSQLTDEDIKQMYYVMAEKYHPDMQEGNEERFKRIGEAYEILGDKDKRARYDQLLRNRDDMSYDGEG